MSGAQDQAPGLPPDAVKVETASRLLGVTSARIAQLVRDGRAVRPRRGYISLVSLLRGYAGALREAAGRPASDGLSRGHAAKAQITEAAVDARRAELIEREGAEAALAVIEREALHHLRGLTTAAALKGLDAATAARLKAEVAAAAERITDAHARALAFVRTGDERHVGVIE